MIRLLRAFLGFRLRVAWNAFRRTERRDAVEVVSQAAVTAVGVMMALVLIPIALGLGVFGAFAGYHMTRAPESAPLWLYGLRIVFVIPLIGIAIGPFLQGPQGFEVLTRFVLLPIPRRTLVVLDLASHLAEFWVLVFVPALLALPLGIALAGRPLEGAVVAAAALLYLAAMGGTGALLTRGVQIVFRERRRREVLSVAVMIGISAIGILPMLFERQEPRRPASGIPGWTAAIPSDLVAGCADAALRHDAAGVGGRLAALGLLTVGLFVGAAAAFRRCVEEPGSVARRGVAALDGERGARWRRERSPFAAVARAQAEAILRSVRGKVIVLGTPLVFLVIAKAFPLDFSETARAYVGPGFWIAGSLFVAVSLQPIALNQFTADGPGAARLFLAPLTPLEIVRGKAAGLYAAAALTTALLIPSSLLTPGHADPRTWIAAAGVALAGHAVLLPVQAVLASVFPARVDLNQFGRRGGAAHPLGSIIASLVSSAAFGCPALAAWLASRTLGAGAAVAIAWALAAGAAVAGWALLPLGARALDARRDNILLVASGR